MREKPEHQKSVPEIEPPVDDKRAHLNAAKVALNQAREDVKAAKKRVDQAKDVVKTLKKTAAKAKKPKPS